MADNQFARWIGGSPLWVLVRLLLLSLVVGVILSALGLDPLNILASLESLVRHLFSFGFDTVERLWRYIVLGAVIVVPLWLITRIASRGR
ncbi:MAG: integrase [Ancylobacter novellus]|uniref:Integrase n=1 Tax=Ancylobacter novellus TaxID=921 RepID=A0A2W5QNZ8_ANCNO|nr:MAG: integrase [Ancylobacter novellus]